MKKTFASLLCLVLFISVVLTPLKAQEYTIDQRSRAIHVVYDDSGSMIKDDDGVYLDRWGQAKYAMEVFAVMLEEEDTMAVYYMSDLDTFAGGSVNAPPRISISGSEPAAARVSTIHDTVTRAGSTPYDAVAKAYADLRNAAADEKWLVVLTDGEFNRLGGQSASNVDVDGFFSQYVNESDVKIIFLAIGDEPVPIRANPGRGIFFEHARNSDEILGKITSICNQIFNRNRHSFTNESRREFSFDIPMAELLVFAQGPDVKINGMRGDAAHSPSETVNVRYSEVAATNYANDPRVLVSRNLTGTVATFRNIPKGTYSLDVTGAQTVEVYYKPVVNVDIRLYQGAREIRAQDIYEGKYRIEYGIVNEDGKFFESSLLGAVTYEAAAVNGSQAIPIRSGDTIELKEGLLRVQVQARFLGINTAENTVTRRVVIKPPLLERIRDWIRKFWFIFWPLVGLLAALLLYWLLWGRKKRFPKYMASKPTIQVERDGNTTSKFGSFKIKPKTKWLPFIPETGTIVAAPDGKLPSLNVRALGNGQMELTNTGDFSEDRLGGVEFYINDIKLVEGSAKKKVISCTAKIKSVYYGAGVATTHTCSFTNKNKKSKKRRK